MTFCLYHTFANPQECRIIRDALYLGWQVERGGMDSRFKIQDFQDSIRVVEGVWLNVFLELPLLTISCLGSMAAAALAQRPEEHLGINQPYIPSCLLNRGGSG